MEHHHLIPRNSEPVPWYAHRPISGQDGYFWTFFSPNSDIRVVYWVGCDARLAVEVGTVRPRFGDPNARYTAVDHDLERLTASHNPEALAQVLALHHRAARLAAQRAVAEVQEITAGRDSPTDIRDFERCVERAGIQDWDMDYVRMTPLSGHDGDPTPESLLVEMGVDTEPDDPIHDALEARYTDAFIDAWRDELLRIARERIAQATQDESG